MPGSYFRALELGAAHADWQLLADSADDVLFQVDAEGGIIWITDSIEHIIGIPGSDIVGTVLATRVHPDDADVVREARARTMSGESTHIPLLRVRRADGQFVQVEARARPLRDADGVVIGSLVRWHDISERLGANRAFRTLVEGNRAMLRADGEDELLQQMCELIPREGGYAFAWYGVPVNDDEKSVRVVAKGGEDHGYVDSIQTSWGEGPLGQGPTGTALRTGQTQVRGDLATDPRFAPWREKALLRGVRCSIALPVTVHGVIHGALMVYANEEGAFDARSQELLESLAADLGFAIERFRDARARVASEQRYRLLAENAMDLVAELDPDGIVTWVSPSVSSVLGFDPGELIGRPGKGVLVTVEGDASARPAATLRAQLRRKDGNPIWMEVTTRRLIGDDGAFIGWALSARDIDQQVHAEIALNRELEFDSLTGLAKKSLTLSRIREILDTRRTRGWALLCVGVDGLTAINQAFTYAAGDEVLREVAQRIVVAAGTHDRVGRIAGDEFAVLLRDVVTPADAAAAAQRLLAAVRGPIYFDDSRVDVTACVGIAMLTEKDAESLLRDATAAMRMASRQGRDRWAFLDQNVADSSRRVLEMQTRLHDALGRGEVEPWFMGIYHLQSGRRVGFEALTRWRNADGSVTAPDEYLRVAERSSLIVELDRSMLRQSLAALGRMEPDQFVAVNLSAATLAVVDIHDFVLTEVEAAGVAIDRLHLEVTETQLFHADEDTIRQMRLLASLGIDWWVDDFGTGYSSISHLRDMPVAGVKLDRSFTEAVVAPGTRAATLTHGLAGLANGLGLQTVAEGVESKAQAQILAEQGWQLAQGFYFAEPGPLPF